MYSLPRYAINDISLMNLSNHLTDLLYISSYPNLCFNQVLFFQVSVSNLQRFNLFYLYQTPFSKSPFCWDCKGKNLFNIVKLFFKSFFLLSPGLLPGSQRDNNSYTQTNQPHSIILIPNLPPKRDAKVEKIPTQTN